ncbi:MAG: hypothetical protein H6737_30085 [Alphaproteobacteria bacterium]|nr:hypothetical protein [Alphaproteobacteria bacterium]
MTRILPLFLLACRPYGPDTPLVALDDVDRAALCEDAYGVSEAVLADCGLVIPVRVEPLAHETCAATWFPADACEVTVEQWEACQTSIAADACTLQVGSDACAPLEACGLHLWSAALGLDGGLALESMQESDILAVCAVTNDYEAFSIECEDGPIAFEPIPDACAGFGFGGCGTLGQIIDCQLDILNAGEDLCEQTPASCLFTDCGQG